MRWQPITAPARKLCQGINNISDAMAAALGPSEFTFDFKMLNPTLPWESGCWSHESERGRPTMAEGALPVRSRTQRSHIRTLCRRACRPFRSLSHPFPGVRQLECVIFCNRECCGRRARYAVISRGSRRDTSASELRRPGLGWAPGRETHTHRHTQLGCHVIARYGPGPV